MNNDMFTFLRNEILLTTGSDGLPRDAGFQPFRLVENNLNYNIFGASEYAKDGLTPVVELLGGQPGITEWLIWLKLFLKMHRLKPNMEPFHPVQQRSMVNFYRRYAGYLV